MKILDETIDLIFEHINSTCTPSEILINGPRDCGKSHIIKSVLKRYKKNKDVFVLYITGDKNHDTILRNIFFNIYNQSNEDSLNNILPKDTFERYLTKRQIFSHLCKQALRAINVAAAHCTGTAPLIVNDAEFFMQELNGFTYIKLLIKYLHSISRKKKTIIALDNYNELDEVIIFLINNLSIKCKKNLLLILATEREKKIEQNYKFLSNYKSIELDYLSPNYIAEFFKKNYNFDSENANELANHFVKITKGQYSQLCTYIKKNEIYLFEKKTKKIIITSTNEILNSLDNVQKSLIFVSSIFPEGLRKKYIYEFYDKFNSINDTHLDYEINELIKDNILFYNGDQGDSLKLLNKSLDFELKTKYYTDDIIEYLSAIKTYLESILSNNNLQNYEYSYILYCTVLLFNSEELFRNVDKIIVLINLEHSFCLYGNISRLFEKLYSIVELLPKSTILQILDALQKDLNFEKGLALIKKITNFGGCDDNILLNEAKYLTQLYNYEAALKVLNQIKDCTNETLYVELNVLQQLFYDEIAKNKIDAMIKIKNQDKWYYIVLRNSAHLYMYEPAIKNLQECLVYFKKNKFESASVKNNIGLVYLWHNEIRLAKKYLDGSIKTFKEILSPEIFEPYCNRSVLYFLQNHKEECLNDIKNALDYLPRNLTMDNVLLQSNKIIFELFFSIIDIKNAIKKFEYIEKTYDFKDQWTEFLIKFNLYNLSDDESYKFNYDFYHKITSTNNTRFELFHDININGKCIRIMLGLSPHWRY